MSSSVASKAESRDSSDRFLSSEKDNSENVCDLERRGVDGDREVLEVEDPSGTM